MTEREQSYGTGVTFVLLATRRFNSEAAFAKLELEGDLCRAIGTALDAVLALKREAA